MDNKPQNIEDASMNEEYLENFLHMSRPYTMDSLKRLVKYANLNDLAGWNLRLVQHMGNLVRGLMTVAPNSESYKLIYSKVNDCGEQLGMVSNAIADCVGVDKSKL